MRKAAKKRVVEKPKVSVNAEPQISKNPNDPWHVVTERYGNELKPKFQVIEGTTNRKGK